MSWTEVAREEELRRRGRCLYKQGGRQVALFHDGERSFAIDNRCPHEGYPLLQGTLDGQSVLTCQWHNWKFDLRDGTCVLGEDHVRSYPLRIVDGAVEIDLRDPPLDQVREKLLAGLREGVGRRQYGRVSRELARLEQAGLDPLLGVRETLRWTHDRFEYGATHALPACADWLRLWEEADDPETRLVCLTEAVDHFAFDTLREPAHPFPEAPAPFVGEDWLAAVEAEDQGRAIALLQGALADGFPWQALEPWFTRAALAHYNDFGHALIYVLKTGELVERLGAEVLPWLLLPLTRRLVQTTREDLIPDFSSYGSALADFPAFGSGAVALDAAVGLSIKRALRWTVEAAAHATPDSLYRALLYANAHNLWCFDASRQHRSAQPVSQNVGWLDFTHGLTFANAVRRQCGRQPALWPAGLLQLACFAGRNVPFVGEPPEAEEHAAGFFADCRELVLDHGDSEPIFACHLLKTFVAVRDEVGCAEDARLQGMLKSALARYLHAPLKRKHTRRTAFQNLALVGRGASRG